MRARVVVNQAGTDGFAVVERRMEQKARQAVDAAAHAAAKVAEQQASGISEFRVLPARGTHEGFVSGVKALNPLVRIFDKGSLGKRRGRLKRDRRKDSWKVTRKGTTYTAHRKPEALTGSTGVQARNIFGPARAAGRKALKAALHR